MNHTLLVGDARHLPLADRSVHLCVTSPPYYSLRKYTSNDREIGRSGRGGLAGYLNSLSAAFAEVRRVLRDDGMLILNLGDTYACKQLLGVPWQVAFRLRNEGWILRSDSVWAKPNGMPDASNDRPEHQHEYLMIFAKTIKPYWDKYAVERPDRLSVRMVPVGRSKCKHFASYPVNLILPYIKQGTSAYGCCSRCDAPWTRVVEKVRTPTRPGRANTVDATGMAKRDHRRHVTRVTTLDWKAGCDCHREVVRPVVLDPFAGTCTTAVACEWSGRDSVMVDLDQDFLDMGRRRLATEKPPKVKAPKAVVDPRAPLPGQMEFPVFSPITGQSPATS